MDAKDIQSDLRALKRLYGLLKKDGDGTSNTASDLLDEHARLLLKNMLDAATQKVLKVHSEIIAGQPEASGTLSPTQLQQPHESYKEGPTPLPKLSIAAEGSQSCAREMDSDKDRKLNGLDITLWKEKRFTPQWSEEGAVEQSIQSVLASGPEHRKKRCRVCQRNTVKHLQSVEETHFYDAAQSSTRFTDLQHLQNNESDLYLWSSEQETGSLLSNKADESKREKGRQTGPSVNNLNGIGYTDFSSDRMVTDIAKVCNSDIEATSKPEEVDCLSKEASKAIKQIELCISAFHIGADHLHLFEENSAQRQNCVLETKSAGPAMRTQYGAIPSVDMGQSEESSTTRNNLLSEYSSRRVVDPVGYPLHQVPSMTAEGINQPYLFLSQASKLVQPTKDMLRESTNNFIRSRGPAFRSDVSGELGESIEEFKFPTKKVNKIHGQNVKAIIDKIESGNWIMSRNDFVPHNVQNFRVQLDPSETSSRTPSWPATFSSASKMEGPYQSHVAKEDECSRRRLFQTHKPSASFMYLNNSENIQSVDSGLNVSSTSGAGGKNHPRKIMGESLLDKKPSQLLVCTGFHENQSDAQQEDEIPKNRHYITAARTSLQHQESEGTATDSYSSWRSQQTSSRDSDSEEYSLTDQTRELQYATSSMGSESGVSPLSHGTGSQYSSYTSNSEDEVYSSASGEAAHKVTSTSSSRSEGYSSYDQPIPRHARPTYLSMQSTSKKSGTSRIRKANDINNKNQTGTWKRLKDRLAIIFHHHHHHHHHNRDDCGNDQTNTSRNTSLHKRKGKVTNFKRQDKACGEKAVEKMRKSLIHEKNQQNHFHGLMEGLLRHVRHSKQSKPGNETIGQLTKDQHGRKKTLKKSHWWQLLQHHRGAKLPNKTHVKLGLGKKKARLKALPKMK